MEEDKKKEESKFEVMETKVSNDMLITVTGKEGRFYRFSIPFRSPLLESYHAAINAANEIARLFKEAVENSKKNKEEREEKQTEETKSE